MHVEFKVSLLDHDWVVTSGYKLILSVYAGMTIKANGFGDPKSASYSGPTYITIHLVNHSSSTAYSHALNLEYLITSTDFQNIVINSNGDIKPVFVITVDGGPDENPRIILS